MNLAAFLEEPEPEPVVSPLDILDLERKHGTDPREGEGHQGDQCAIPEASDVRRDRARPSFGPGEGNAVEEKPHLGCSQDIRLAAFDREGRSFDRGRRVGGEKTAGDQPVEQAAEGCQMQLDRGALMGLFEAFDIGADMDGTDLSELRQAYLIAPGKEPDDGAMIGLSGIFVTDGGDEEFDEALGGAVTG